MKETVINATPRERHIPKIFPIGEIDSIFKKENGDQCEGKRWNLKKLNQL